MNQFPAVNKNDSIVGYVVKNMQGKFFPWSYCDLEKVPKPMIVDANLQNMKEQCQCIRRSQFQGLSFDNAITSMITTLFSNPTVIS